MTQDESVLKHLQAGKTITPLQALREYGSLRLGAIIHRLRGRGYDIVTHRVSNRGRSFAQYELINQRKPK